MAAAKAGRSTFSELFPQLFLFPLLIVVVGVLIYLFVAAAGQDHRNIEGIIRDIESGGQHARNQDAFALAIQVASLPPGEYLSPEITQHLIRIRERSLDDPEFTKYITMALGRAGVPSLTLPILQRLALDRQTDQEIRTSAVTALGLQASLEAADVLALVAAQTKGPEEWELRWVALGGLASLQHQNAKVLLREALGAPRREVRWSAACWLATKFDDPAGSDILDDLVSWEFLDSQRGDLGRKLQFAEKEGYMIQALKGLAAVRGQQAHSLLERLSGDARSPKVRNAAFRALKQFSDSESLEDRSSESVNFRHDGEDGAFAARVASSQDDPNRWVVEPARPCC